MSMSLIPITTQNGFCLLPRHIRLNGFGLYPGRITQTRNLPLLIVFTVTSTRTTLSPILP